MSDYIFTEGHEGHCDPMWSCCDECLKLNGFDIDDSAPPVTLADVIEANRLKPECDECGFPVDPDNEVHPAGAECICDLKEASE